MAALLNALPSSTGRSLSSFLLALSIAGCTAQSSPDDEGKSSESDEEKASASEMEAESSLEVGERGDAESTKEMGCTSTSGDQDGDGFSVEEGDCNDCDKNTNPGALEVAESGADEDCDDKVDEAPDACDSSLDDKGENDAMVAAQAIGLCKTTTLESKEWGLIEARYVHVDGTDFPDEWSLSHGILPKFGDSFVPLEGERLLALSSGSAREKGDEDYFDPYGPIDYNDPWYTTGHEVSMPDGFPIDTPSCPDVVTPPDAKAIDSVGLELTIRTPSNAQTLSFDFSYFTSEYPSYVCDQFNDAFVALLEPKLTGADNANISFDSDGNIVSVNNGLLEYCTPGTFGGKVFDCQYGLDALSGTGFDGYASTGWLRTQSPVPAGEVITLTFGIWDAGDGVLNSTTLIDNFAFSGEPAADEAVTERSEIIK